jgi:ABC-type sulfate transport system permease component
MVLISIPEVILIVWFLARVSLVGCAPRTALAKLFRCVPTLVAGLLLTFAIGHVLRDYVGLQMKLEQAGSNIWEPVPNGTTRSAG